MKSTSTQQDVNGEIATLLGTLIIVYLVDNSVLLCSLRHCLGSELYDVVNEFYYVYSVMLRGFFVGVKENDG